MLWLCESNFAVHILLMIYYVTVSRSAFYYLVPCGRYHEYMSLIVVSYLNPVKPVSSTVATLSQTTPTGK